MISQEKPGCQLAEVLDHPTSSRQGALYLVPCEEQLSGWLVHHLFVTGVTEGVLIMFKFLDLSTDGETADQGRGEGGR